MTYKIKIDPTIPVERRKIDGYMKPVPFFTIIRKIQKVCHPQGYRMTYYEEKDGYVHIAMEKNNDVRIQPV